MTNPFDKYKQPTAPSGNPFDKYKPSALAEPPTLSRAPKLADVGAALAGGVGSVVRGLGVTGGLVTGDVNNPVTELGKSVEEYWGGKKSEGLQRRVAARSAAIDASPTLLGKAGTAIAETVTDPGLFVDTLASTAASMLPAGAAGRVGTLLSGSSKVGLGAAVGTGAVQAGADVAGGQFDDALNAPDEVWQQNPEFTTRVGAGEDAAAVKNDLALRTARLAFPGTVALSALTQKLPGAATLERAFAGGLSRAPGIKGTAAAALKGGLGEATQEALEEGGGQFVGNLAAREVIDPNTDLTRGVGEGAGLGAVAGFGLGSVTGALSRPPVEPPATPKAEPQQAPVVPETLASQAQPGPAPAPAPSPISSAAATVPGAVVPPVQAATVPGAPLASDSSTPSVNSDLAPVKTPPPDPTYDRAAQIMAASGKVSRAALSKELGLTGEQTTDLLKQFEAAGVISPYVKGKPRTLLANPLTGEVIDPKEIAKLERKAEVKALNQAATTGQPPAEAITKVDQALGRAPAIDAAPQPATLTRAPPPANKTPADWVDGEPPDFVPTRPSRPDPNAGATSRAAAVAYDTGAAAIAEQQAASSAEAQQAAADEQAVVQAQQEAKRQQQEQVKEQAAQIKQQKLLASVADDDDVRAVLESELEQNGKVNVLAIAKRMGIKPRQVEDARRAIAAERAAAKRQPQLEQQAIEGEFEDVTESPALKQLPAPPAARLYPFPTLKAAQNQAALLSKNKGVPHQAAPHPTKEGRFAAVPADVPAQIGTAAQSETGTAQPQLGTAPAELGTAPDTFGATGYPYDDSQDQLEDDITPPSGSPWTIRTAADAKAKRTPGGKVFEVEGGFVVRVPLDKKAPNVQPTQLVQQIADSDAQIAPFNKAEQPIPAAATVKESLTVAAAKPKEALATDVAGEQLDGKWTSFAPDTGTLNIPRAQMPQIKSVHRGAMVQFLGARGITHEQAEVPAASLKPTQAEFSAAKVKKALGRAAEGEDRAILVSSDGHVLDGHHQWLAKREANAPVKVIRLNAPIAELLTQVKEFPSAKTAGGAKVEAGKPPQAADFPDGQSYRAAVRAYRAANPVTPAATQPDRRAAIKRELADLEKNYKKRMNSPDGIIPPAIKADALGGISRRMEKLEAELKALDARAEVTLEAAPMDAGTKVTTPSANTIFTEDAAEAARARLKAKFNRLNSGLDPEMMLDGITLAGYHIERGARTFAAYAKAMVDDLGVAVRPYLKSWYSAVKMDPRAATFEGMDSLASVETAALPEVDSAPEPSSQMADWVLGRLSAGQAFNWREMFGKADEVFGGTQGEGKYTPKDAYDAVEAGINRYIMANPQVFNPANASVEKATQAVDALGRVLNLIPTQTKRTAEQDEFQQFSTVPPFAYVANWVAGVTDTDVMMEPSAGIGGLAVFSHVAGARLILNELSSRRAAVLQQVFPTAKVYTENAEQIDNILPATEIPTVVVMNPPFSATAGRIEGSRDTKVGAQHVEQALARLPEGGRLVAIVGQGMALDASTFRQWWTKIRAEYDVRAVIPVDGSGYAKYGTTFDNVLLVIDKVKPKPGRTILSTPAASYTELVGQLAEIRNDRPTAKLAPDLGATERDAAERTRKDALSEGKSPVDGQSGAGVAGGVDGKSPKGGSGSSSGGGRGGKGGGRGPRGNVRQPGGQPDAESDNAGTGSGVDGEPTGGSAGGSQPPEQSGLTITSEDATTGELTEAIFEQYQPQKLRVPGAKPHPGELVQSAAMASVLPPDATYTPNLPAATITEGKLSIAQIEAVVYAGQAHEQMLPNGDRRGFFIGDGTGVGKGREIGGILLDNIRRGRTKHVWVSEKQGLMVDAKRDLKGVGGDDNSIFNQQKTKAEEAINQSSGVLFTTYATLRSGAQSQDKGEKTPGDGKKAGQSRLDQLVKWLGADFDGVIVFDEAHNAGNAVPIKGKRGNTPVSAQALAVVELQKMLPKARVVYVSATGASRVENFSYATRLGLWGKETAFPEVSNFISEMVAGGLATMELIARDIKQMGAYMARSLSYRGVSYSRLEHQLSPTQREIYDRLAEAWQVVLQNIEKALQMTGATGDNGKATAGNNAKSKAMSAFWGSQQRFFNQVITSMQMPSVIAQMEQDIAAGEALVLQLVNTNEAQQERVLSKRQEEDDSGDLEDLDLTPRDQLLNMVENAFPVVQMEGVMGDNGRVTYSPVIGSDGSPVLNRQAVALRDKLLQDLKDIRVPDGPLEMVINHFGPDVVAEVTGRKRRVVRRANDDGDMVPTIEQRGSSAARADADAFMADKRRVLIFSDAGGTGFSFHADLTKKNQRKRKHYLIQPGWRADKAVQGFGRTHRTNQASAPHYFLAATDIPAHKRFLSSIARRLDQLGALTKGQRDTANQGMFSEKDNLESIYAKQAIDQLFKDIQSQQVKGITLDEFLSQMGFEGLLDQETGQISEDKIPATSQFLNRLLSLKLDMQERVFDAFIARMEEKVDLAASRGELDAGLETIKALETRVMNEDVVYIDPRTKAETRLVDLELLQSNEFYQFPNAKRQGGAAEWVVNNTSGRVWLKVLSGTHTNAKTGEVQERFRMMGTNGTGVRVASELVGKPAKPLLNSPAHGPIYPGDIVEYRVFGNNSEPSVVTATKAYPDGRFAGISSSKHLPDFESTFWSNQITKVTPGPRTPSDAPYKTISEGKARDLWEEENAARPTTVTRRTHMLVGALIPIWDRIKVGSKMRVARTQTVDGQRLLGRVLSTDDVGEIRRRLNISAPASKLSAADIQQEILNGKVGELANGWKIKRSMVSGEQRIELLDRMERPAIYGADAKSLIADGLINERIQWVDRYFIPSGPAGVKVLESLLRAKPIIDLKDQKQASKTGNDEGKASFAKSGEAPTPQPSDWRFGAYLLRELSKLEGFFQYPTSPQTQLGAVVRDVSRGNMRAVLKGTVEVNFTEDFEDTREAQKWEIAGADGQPIYVYVETNGNRLYIDASQGESGASRGSAIYASLFQFALNTNKVFIGDPNGLSIEALLRRTEHMLSAAIKHGTTRMMAPHPRQVNPMQGQWEGGPQSWAHPLRWSENEAENIVSLMKSSYNNHHQFFSGTASEQALYSVSLGRFIGASGQPVSVEQLRRDAASAGKAFSGYRQPPGIEPPAPAIGGASGARYVLIGTLVRAAQRQGRLDTLAEIAERITAGGIDEAIKGIAYGRGANAGPGLSKNKLQSVFKVAIAGMRALGIDVRIAEDGDELAREAPDIVAQDDYDDTVQAAITGDRKTVWFVANRIKNVREALKLFAHELVGHYSMEQMLGPRLFRELSGRIMSLKERGKWPDVFAEVSRRYERNPDGTFRPLDDATFAAEAIAVFAERNIQTSILQRALNAVRAFLRKFFPQLELSQGELRQILWEAGQYLEGKPYRPEVATRALGERPAASLQEEMERYAFGKAWHASPHDFEQFKLDNSTIGTGEGRQAFGHGLYFAGSKKVAEWYRKNISEESVSYKGEYIDNSPDHPELAKVAELITEGFSISDAIAGAVKAFNADIISDARFILGKEKDKQTEELEALSGKPVDAEFAEFLGLRTVSRAKASIKRAKEAIANLRSLDANDFKVQKNRIYEVELAPDDSSYLNWDKKLSEQSDMVRDAIERNFARLNNLNGQELLKRNPTGREIYKAVSPDQALASKELLADGIPGIRYLDGISRSKGGGDYNYVIFDEKQISIRAKFAKDRATININGVERPTTDSTGKRIHPTEEGLRNFWAWFGDSKVVDEQGRPLVVYHGTTASFDTFDPDLAGKNFDDPDERGMLFSSKTVEPNLMTVAQDKATGRISRDGGNVMPVYLALKDPLIVEFDGKTAVRRFGVASATTWYDNAKAEILHKADRNDHDGVIVRSPVMSDGYRAADTLVAFEPEQIKSAFGNTGAFSPADARVNFAKAGTLVDRIQDVINPADTTLLQRLKDKLADWRPAALGALQLRHLGELASRILPPVALYSGVVQRMATMRNELQELGHKVVEAGLKYQSKNRKEATKLFRMLHDATLAGVDPAEAHQVLTMQSADYKTNVEVTYKNVQAFAAVMREQAKLNPGSASTYINRVKEARKLLSQERRRFASYVEMAPKFATLSTEGQDLWKQMRDAYRAQSEKYEEALISRIESLDFDKAKKAGQIARMRLQFESARVPFYVPLARWGNYWVSGTNADGQREFFMQESAGDQRRMRDQLAKAGYTEVGHGVKLDTVRAQDGASASFMAEIDEMLKKSGAPEKIRDEAFQLYLQAMPDLSIRKNFIHRQGTPGYSQDAVRALAGHIFHGSFQIARLRHSHELEALRTDAEAMAKDMASQGDEDANAAGNIVNELKKRHEWVLNPQDNALVNKISSIGFVYYLGLTPAAALVNLLQTPMVALPILAGNHKLSDASRELWRAMKQSLGTYGHMEKQLEGEELAAHVELARRGGFDKAQAHSMAGVSESDTHAYSPGWHKTMTVISHVFHKAEVINREATAMAAYRLAKASGASHAEAIETADAQVHESQFDYSNANRARFMQSGTAKVLLMFRQYSLAVTWLLGRNLYQSLKGEDAATRKEAQRKLAGILGMTALFSGTLGLPMLGTIGAVLNAVAAAFGDDDEPWDWETEFRAFLRDMLGEKGAEVVLRGPVQAATGVGIASRVSMGDLWFREPDRELEGRAWSNYLFEQAAGPMGGLITNFFRAQQMMGEGHVWRGVETMMPKAIKDGMKSIRYLDEGVNNMRGDPIVEDLNVFESLAQIAGFAPASVANAYDVQGDLKNYEQAILNRRSRLMDSFALAWRLGDTDAREAILAKMRKFSQTYPELAITSDSIRRSLMSRAAYSAKAEHGVIVDRRIKARLEGQLGL